MPAGVAVRMGLGVRAALGAALLILGSTAAQAACPVYAATDPNPATGPNPYTVDTSISIAGPVGSISFTSPSSSLSVTNNFAVTGTADALTITSGGGTVCYDGGTNALLTSGTLSSHDGLILETSSNGDATATVAHDISARGLGVSIATDSGDIGFTLNGGTVSSVTSSGALAQLDTGSVTVNLNAGSLLADTYGFGAFGGAVSTMSVFVDRDVLVRSDNWVGIGLYADSGTLSVLGAGASDAGMGIYGDVAGVYAQLLFGGTINLGTAGQRLGNVDSPGAAVDAYLTGGGAINVYTGGTTGSVGAQYGVVALARGPSTITIDTAGDVIGEVGISADIDSDSTGDIFITTAAGTTITAGGSFLPTGISATRFDSSYGGGAPTASGSITIVNAATIAVSDPDSTGIFAGLCECTSGAVSVVNRGNVTADFGIVATSSTTVSVEHLAGTITNLPGAISPVGIFVGGADPLTGNETTPVSVTVGEGASIVSPYGIVVADPYNLVLPENPATILVAGRIDSPGSFAISLASAVTNRVEIRPSFEINGFVDSRFSGNDTLAFGGTGAKPFDLSLLTSQYLEFEHLEKTGTSTWTLTGTDPFAGDTTVLGGTLSFAPGASLPNSDVTVSGGQLAGNGTVRSLLVGAGGTLAPGNSIGTTTVVGTATFATGSTYAVEVNPTQSDLTTANAAVINGGTVAVAVLQGNYASTQTYTIVATAAGVTGQFSAVTIDTSFLTPILSSDANNIYLTLNLNPAAGEMHASLLGAFVESDQLRTAALDRAGNEPLTAGANGFAAGDSATGAVPDGIWGRLYGAGGTLLGSGTATTLTHGEGGLIAGSDAPVGDWRLGLLAGYGQTRVAVAARNATASTHDLSGGFYGGGTVGPATLKFGAGYTRHIVATSRTTGIAGITDTMIANYAVGTAQAFAEADSTIDLGAQQIVPFAGLAYLNSHHGAFSETGGPGAITVAAGSYNALVTTLGVRLEHQFAIGDTGLATARASAAWRHVAAGDPSITGSFANSAAFVVAGTAPSRDALVVSGELGLDLSKTWTLDLAYRGQFASSGQTHSATATLAASF